MRPIVLKMTAFGPYKYTETIDFRDLKEHRLFVISGKTGAGKTTIFDGICFALYGLASGEDRTDTEALRSQFADDSEQTTVELTFDIHQKRYRVLRQVAYRKKGNKSKSLARCELYEESGGQSIPVTDRQIATEVNEKIVELLGFSHSQFSQIMMLPQGEFRKFLTSDTADKEKILRKIFKTEPYEKLVDRLKEKKDRAGAAYERERHAIDTVIHQIPAKLPVRESLLFEELASEHRNHHQLMAGLQEECTYHQQQSAAQHTRYTALYAQHDQMQERLHAARLLNEQFNRLHSRNEQLKQLQSRQGQMEALEQTLQAAERAARLEDLEQQLADNEAEWKRKTAGHEEAQLALQEISRQLKEAAVSFEEESDRDHERQLGKEELLKLRELLPAVSGLEEERSELRALENLCRQYTRQIEEQYEWAEAQQEKLASLQRSVTKLEEGLECYEETVDQLTAAAEINRLLQEYKMRHKDWESAASRKKIAKKEADEQSEIYQELEERWIGGQAAELAASLSDGEACPVCGSTHHPGKAVGGEQSVSRNRLDEAKQSSARKEQAYHSVAAEEQQLRQQTVILQEELESRGIEPNREIVKEIEELEQKVNRLRSDREKLKKTKEEQHRLQAELEGLQTRIKQQEEEQRTKQGELTTKRALFEHTLARVPEHMRDLAALKKELHEKERAVRTLEDRWKKVQEQLQEAKLQHTKKESEEQSAAMAIVEAKEKAGLIRSAFMQRLEDLGFDSREQYIQLKLPLKERQDIQQRLQEYSQALHATEAAVKELQAAVRDKEPQDTEAIALQVDQLKEEYEQAFTAYNESLAFMQAAEGLLGQLEAGRSRVAELEKTYGRITDLHDIVRGQNRLKISFERYIQIEYLERIIQAANIRLRDVSNGQFELVRSGRQASHGKQSGLGIDVHDAYTGQTRDVKTLSGGEKFNASLCLALGMADVIQSFQGTVRMETMFIDEGFGALDEEAIQKAIDTLMALQQSGRMIGIISHIDEMKEAIPATLQVTKMKEGYSKTKFVLG